MRTYGSKRDCAWRRQSHRFADFENPVVEKAHWAFSDLDIYVIATGGDHSDLTDDYAAIPHEMKEVANCFGAKLLHEISPQKWERDKQNIVGKVSERAYLRAEHFSKRTHALKTR